MTTAKKPKPKKNYARQNLVWAYIEAVGLDRDLDGLKEFARHLLRFVAVQTKLNMQKEAEAELKAKMAELRVKVAEVEHRRRLSKKVAAVLH